VVEGYVFFVPGGAFCFGGEELRGIFWGSKTRFPFRSWQPIMQTQECPEKRAHTTLGSNTKSKRGKKEKKSLHEN
jgi:hypothetical protein